jgi:hypothetical protein
MWTLAFGHHEDRTPMHGYAETREAAMIVSTVQFWVPNLARCKDPMTAFPFI